MTDEQSSDSIDISAPASLAYWSITTSPEVKGVLETTGWIRLNDAVQEVSAKLPSDGKWHHVVFSHGKKQVTRLYVDHCLVSGPWHEVLLSKIRCLVFKLLHIHPQY